MWPILRLLEVRESAAYLAYVNIFTTEQMPKQPVRRILLIGVDSSANTLKHLIHCAYTINSNILALL